MTIWMREANQPILDKKLERGKDYEETLESHIRQAPFFLCVLTRNTFCTQTEQEWKEDWVYKEICIAQESKRKILLLMEDGFQFPENAPDEIVKISKIHGTEGVNRGNFLERMGDLCEDLDTDKQLFEGVLDWRIGIRAKSNVCMTDRDRNENILARLGDRFGWKLIQALEKGEHFDGETHIKRIYMSCYAVSIIFASDRNRVDERAYERGMLFKLFTRLLEDDEFTLELIINAPGCFAAQDAVEHQKLGNQALEAYPEAIFYGSYCGVQRLIREDIIFQRAYKDRRFRFMVTEEIMPYALFQTEYKEGYEQYDNIKVDLYSGGIRSNMERRCMIIFKKDDAENYDFFAKRYTALRNARESQQLIRSHNDEWLAEWKKLEVEIYLFGGYGSMSNLTYIRRETLEDALDKMYRQYLTGHLERPQKISEKH